jgi:hypothetical protein
MNGRVAFAHIGNRSTSAAPSPNDPAERHPISQAGLFSYNLTTGALTPPSGP